MATSITSTRGHNATVLSSLRNGARELIVYLRRYREYKRAEAQLSALSTRELDDIGLGRGDIRARVWANF